MRRTRPHLQTPSSPSTASPQRVRQRRTLTPPLEPPDELLTIELSENSQPASPPDVIETVTLSSDISVPTVTIDSEESLTVPDVTEIVEITHEVEDNSNPPPADRELSPIYISSDSDCLTEELEVPNQPKEDAPIGKRRGSMYSERVWQPHSPYKLYKKKKMSSPRERAQSEDRTVSGEGSHKKISAVSKRAKSEESIFNVSQNAVATPIAESGTSDDRTIPRSALSTVAEPEPKNSSVPTEQERTGNNSETSHIKSDSNQSENSDATPASERTSPKPSSSPNKDKSPENFCNNHKKSSVNKKKVKSPDKNKETLVTKEAQNRGPNQSNIDAEATENESNEPKTPSASEETKKSDGDTKLPEKPTTSTETEREGIDNPLEQRPSDSTLADDASIEHSPPETSLVQTPQRTSVVKVINVTMPRIRDRRHLIRLSPEVAARINRQPLYQPQSLTSRLLKTVAVQTLMNWYHIMPLHREAAACSLNELVNVAVQYERHVLRLRAEQNLPTHNSEPLIIHLNAVAPEISTTTTSRSVETDLRWFELVPILASPGRRFLVRVTLPRARAANAQTPGNSLTNGPNTCREIVSAQAEQTTPSRVELDTTATQYDIQTDTSAVDTNETENRLRTNTVVGTEDSENQIVTAATQTQPISTETQSTTCDMPEQVNTATQYDPPPLESATSTQTAIEAADAEVNTLSTLCRMAMLAPQSTHTPVQPAGSEVNTLSALCRSALLENDSMHDSSQTIAVEVNTPATLTDSTAQPTNEQFSQWEPPQEIKEENDLNAVGADEDHDINDNNNHFNQFPVNVKVEVDGMLSPVSLADSDENIKPSLMCTETVDSPNTNCNLYKRKFLAKILLNSVITVSSESAQDPFDLPILPEDYDENAPVFDDEVKITNTSVNLNTDADLDMGPSTSQRALQTLNQLNTDDRWQYRPNISARRRSVSLSPNIELAIYQEIEDRMNANNANTVSSSSPIELEGGNEPTTSYAETHFHSYSKPEPHEPLPRTPTQRLACVPLDRLLRPVDTRERRHSEPMCVIHTTNIATERQNTAVTAQLSAVGSSSPLPQIVVSSQSEEDSSIEDNTVADMAIHAQSENSHNLYTYFAELDPNIIWSCYFLRRSINITMTTRLISGRSTIGEWLHEYLRISGFCTLQAFQHNIEAVANDDDKMITFIYFLPCSAKFIGGYETTFRMLHDALKESKVARLKSDYMNVYLYPLETGALFRYGIQLKELNEFLDNAQRPNLLLGVIFHNRDLPDLPDSRFPHRFDGTLERATHELRNCAGIDNNENEVTSQSSTEETANDSEGTNQSSTEETVHDSEVINQSSAEETANDSEGTNQSSAEETANDSEVSNQPNTEDTVLGTEVINQPNTEDTAYDTALTNQPNTEDTAHDTEVINQPSTEDTAHDTEVINQPSTEDTTHDTAVINQPSTEDTVLDIEVINQPSTEDTAHDTEVNNQPNTEETVLDTELSNQPNNETVLDTTLGQTSFESNTSSQRSPELAYDGDISQSVDGLSHTDDTPVKRLHNGNGFFQENSPADSDTTNNLNKGSAPKRKPQLSSTSTSSPPTTEITDQSIRDEDGSRRKASTKRNQPLKKRKKRVVSLSTSSSSSPFNRCDRLNVKQRENSSLTTASVMAHTSSFDEGTLRNGTEHRYVHNSSGSCDVDENETLRKGGTDEGCSNKGDWGSDPDTDNISYVDLSDTTSTTDGSTKKECTTDEESKKSAVQKRCSNNSSSSTETESKYEKSPLQFTSTDTGSIDVDITGIDSTSLEGNAGSENEDTPSYDVKSRSSSAHSVSERPEYERQSRESGYSDDTTRETGTTGSILGVEGSSSRRNLLDSSTDSTSSTAHDNTEKKSTYDMNKTSSRDLGAKSRSKSEEELRPHKKSTRETTSDTESIQGNRTTTKSNIKKPQPDRDTENNENVRSSRSSLSGESSSKDSSTTQTSRSTYSSSTMEIVRSIDSGALELHFSDTNSNHTEPKANVESGETSTDSDASVKTAMRAAQTEDSTDNNESDKVDSQTINSNKSTGSGERKEGSTENTSSGTESSDKNTTTSTSSEEEKSKYSENKRNLLKKEDEISKESYETQTQNNNNESVNVGDTPNIEEDHFVLRIESSDESSNEGFKEVDKKREVETEAGSTNSVEENEGQPIEGGQNFSTEQPRTAAGLTDSPSAGALRGFPEVTRSTQVENSISKISVDVASTSSKTASTIQQSPNGASKDPIFREPTECISPLRTRSRNTGFFKLFPLDSQANQATYWPFPHAEGELHSYVDSLDAETAQAMNGAESSQQVEDIRLSEERIESTETTTQEQTRNIPETPETIHEETTRNGTIETPITHRSNGQPCSEENTDDANEVDLHQSDALESLADWTRQATNDLVDPYESVDLLSEESSNEETDNTQATENSQAAIVPKEPATESSQVTNNGNGNGNSNGNGNGNGNGKARSESDDEDS